MTESAFNPPAEAAIAITQRALSHGIGRSLIIWVVSRGCTLLLHTNVMLTDRRGNGAYPYLSTAKSFPDTPIGTARRDFPESLGKGRHHHVRTRGTQRFDVSP